MLLFIRSCRLIDGRIIRAGVPEREDMDALPILGRGSPAVYRVLGILTAVLAVVGAGYLSTWFGVMLLGAMLGLGYLLACFNRPRLAVYTPIALHWIPISLTSQYNVTLPLSPLLVLIAIGLAVAAITRWGGEPPLKWSPLVILVIVYAAAIAISSLTSAYGNEFTNLGRLNWAAQETAFPLLALLIPALIRREGHQLWIVYLVLLGAGLTSLVALYEFARGELIFGTVYQYYGPFLRGASFLGHATILGVYLSAIVAVSLSITLVRARLPRRGYWLAWLILVLSLVGLIITLARGSWVTTTGLVVLILTSVTLHGGRGRTQLLVSAGALLIIGLSVSLFLPEDFSTRLGTLSSLSEEESFFGRLDRWTALLPAVWEAPFFGFGSATASSYLPYSVTLPTGYTPHSLYVYLLIARGFVGAGAFLGILIVASVSAWRLFSESHRRNDPLNSMLVLVAAMMSLAIALGGLFETIFGHSQAQMIFWTGIGLISAQQQRRMTAPTG